MFKCLRSLLAWTVFLAFLWRLYLSESSKWDSPSMDFFSFFCPQCSLQIIMSHYSITVKFGVISITNINIQRFHHIAYNTLILSHPSSRIRKSSGEDNSHFKRYLKFCWNLLILSKLTCWISSTLHSLLYTTRKTPKQRDKKISRNISKKTLCLF